MTDTQSIKDKLDIVTLIGEYLPLKKAGIYWKACCPFHKEKTPSFMVNAERQFWHCFGCSKSGDIFSFAQEMEGLDFPEALKLLADRAGVKLDNNFQSEVNKSQKNRILEVNAKAAYFYHRFLLDMPASKEAREYLERRQLKTETIADWQVGYIPDQWDLLTQYLLKKGIGIDDMVAAGLTIKKDPSSPSATPGKPVLVNNLARYYDRFRDRIMFPIWNVHGDVVGFTGRQLHENLEAGGKYVNTPQTLVYDKSRVLYGLNKAKTEIKSKDLVVMVEGQMDVIACHQAGMKNVVAASGTAFKLETDDTLSESEQQRSNQFGLIKRYTNNIKMAFDADGAGVNAVKRVVGVAIKEGLNVGIIKIPEGAGKDADECLKKNPDVWFMAVKNAREIMEWLFDMVLVGKNLSSPKDKQTVADDFLSFVGLIPYSIIRDHWLKLIAEKLDTNIVVMKENLVDLQKRTRLPQSKKDVTTTIKPVITDSFERRRERCVLAVLKYPALFSCITDILPVGAYAGSGAEPLYEWLKNQYNINANIKKASDLTLTADFDINPWQMRAELEFVDYDEERAKEEVLALVREIKDEWLKRRRAEVQHQMVEAEKSGNRDEQNKLLIEFQNLK
ncbi:MAG: DNA primase [Candidatus Magasanikbacteria bacterium RIFOXYC2_FULL_42_28]|uniref:DNA primase n=1 Tax=Candidatus Magasanikbacteria bacterium RIFOXYC2_FULL_42_28 TaxID=1798704 RepID=A0A1F6NY18_9BACT|nr:MAG: DNA primase [Candidatus Magasanikbacteria bacterium RIFOXYC2_FULL_42_28]